jgi:hypothetical protein
MLEVNVVREVVGSPTKKALAVNLPKISATCFYIIVEFAFFFGFLAFVDWQHAGGKFGRTEGKSGCIEFICQLFFVLSIGKRLNFVVKAIGRRKLDSFLFFNLKRLTINFSRGFLRPY